MIELRTGIPGSGKTLSMVEALSKMFPRWEKHPEEARPVFVHNIKNLALPHATLPLKEIEARGGQKQMVPDWDALPDGSLVIVDECQDLFPPRSAQSAAPPYIAFFNTHRHKGFDIWLTTQHPKLIDFSVRALIGKHIHFRRLFGMQRAAQYEWDGCSDNLGGMKDAVLTHYAFPKKAFEFYKSAELHTKQSFKLPRWLIIPVIGIALGVFMIPRAYSVLSGSMTGKGLASSSAKPLQDKTGGVAPAAQGPDAGLQRPLPIANAAAPGVGVPVKPVMLGCIHMRDRCECFDGSMARVKSDPEACHEASYRVGTVLLPLIVADSKPSPSDNKVFASPGSE